jgi:hypothetical protein
LSNRSVEEQIAYGCLWNNTDCSEIKRDITAAQQELDRANDRTQSVTREAAEARTAFRHAKKVVKDAGLEKQMVTDEIDILRPKVEDAPADSGLVEAYREAIAVYIPAQTGANFDRTHKRGSKSFWHSLLVSEMHRTRPLRHTHGSWKSQRGRKKLLMM